MTEWKKIEGFSNYSVSNDGMVRNDDRNHVLSPKKERHGYLWAVLYKEGKAHKIFLHRLVASAFIPNPEKKRTVNHIDGNPHNNNVSNLEWATDHENIWHSYNMLDSKKRREKIGNYHRGSKNVNAKKIRCEETGCIFDCMRDASRKMGIDISCISEVCNGKREKIKGYHFSFVEGGEEK